MSAAVEVPVDRPPWWQTAAAHAVAPALALALVAIAAYSLGAAEWVSDSAGYVAGLWLGALCGLALALSRFRSRWAGAYSLALSLAAAGEAAGGVVSPLLNQVGQPWPDLVWGLHIRLGTLGDRMADWASAGVSGQIVRDDGLFIFLLAVLMWQAGAWLAWTLARQQSAFNAVWPLALILAVNNHLARRPNEEFAAFLAGCALLLGSSAYRAAHQDWTRRQVDYPESLGLEWGLSQALLAVIIGVLVISAPLVGTPAGWRTLADLFRAARAETAETASRLFADVNPPRADVAATAALTPNLTTIGQPLPRGADVVMWVSVSDPAPLPPESGVPETLTVPQHYWRSQIFATYTGQGWLPVAAPTAAAAALSADAPPPGRYRLEQRFEIPAAHSRELFTVNVPISATAGTSLEPLAELDQRLTGEVDSYAVTSWATTVTRQQLEAVPARWPAEIEALYLQLPPTLPERVRALARQITAPAATPFAKALAVEAYLRATYPYRLEVPAAPGGRDAVDYFLFDVRAGFCTYYASAMTVLLRAEGVPARIVSGFTMGSYDYDRRAYRVPAEAAHAWVEVYFPGYGWVEFEPTVSQGRFDYGPETAAVSGAAGPPAPAQTPTADWRWLWGVAVAGLAAALGGLGWWLRRAPTPRVDPAGRLYWQIRAALADLELPASPSTTPDEFLTACAPALAGRPALAQAVAEATRLYVRTLYSARPVPADDARHAATAWRQAGDERRRLRWGVLWRRLRANGRKWLRRKP